MCKSKLACVLGILITCCLTVKAQTTFKALMENYRFSSFRDGELRDNYFVINNNVHEEYSKGILFARSEMKWLSGDAYRVTLNWVREGAHGLMPGDTMFCKIRYLKKDTLLMDVRFSNFQGVAKYVRTKMPAMVYPQAPQKLLIGYTFISLQPGAGTGDFWTIKDSTHREYSNGKLFSVSKVKWLSPRQYELTFQWLSSEVDPAVLATGDIVNVKIISFRNDILTIQVSAKGINRIYKYRRSIGARR